jgi:thioredoxin reductase
MTTEVTIVGAGPYGLSLAAHLKAQGVPFRIFGVPMGFWKTSMPAGMKLKSDGHASSLYEPSHSLPLSRFCDEQGLPYDDLALPVALETFVSYGVAFQERFVPDVEQRTVDTVTHGDEGFVVGLDNGEVFTTSKLVVATGVTFFEYIPPALKELPQGLVSHSSQTADLRSFVNEDVAIVGAGSSALDLAALLNQIGARPIIITRRPALEFHTLQTLPRTLRSRILAPTSGVGPGWRGWLACNAQLLFHRQSEQLRLRVVKGFLGPAGGWSIRDAVLGKVPVALNSVVEAASEEGGRARLRLSDKNGNSTELMVDRVIAATGFKVDVERIRFLDSSLRSRIATLEGAPVLNSYFEASVPGLFFVGAAAVNSFGPAQRFAVGAKFAARRVSRRLARTLVRTGHAIH